MRLFNQLEITNIPGFPLDPTFIFYICFGEFFISFSSKYFAYHKMSQFRTAIQDHNSGSQFRTTIQDHNSGSQFRITIQDHNSGPQFRITIQDHNSGPQFRTIIQDHNLGSQFRTTVQDHNSGPQFRFRTILRFKAIKILITRLIVIDITPLTVLFCNCPLVDL